MNNLRITLTSSDLSKLVSSAGQYPLIVDFLKSDGTQLNNPNVPNTFSASVSAVGQSLTVNIPILSGTYSIPGVQIKVYSGSRSNCCFVEYSYTISNSEGTQPVVDGIIDGNRITTKGGKTLLTFGSQDMWFEHLNTGNVRLIAQTERPSFNGQRTCKPIFLGSYMQDLPVDFIAALLSPQGANIPSGLRIACTIFNYPTDPAMGTTMENLAPNQWQAWGNPATYETHCSQIERASFYLL